MIWLTPEMAGKILRDDPPFSPDLGISWVDRVNVDRAVLESIARERGGVFAVGDSVVKLEIRSRHYYKLEGTPPVLWIDGIKMHEGDVLERAAWKARFARGRVLDICTGLGYSAIASSERAEVITVEVDPNVLDLARLNPWSQPLFSRRNIQILVEDASRAVSNLEGPFDCVIHDPPRFSLAGQLYSRNFYRELYRLLDKDGVLYHYTGSPGHLRGKGIRRGILSRLRAVGFRLEEEDRYGYWLVK